MGPRGGVQQQPINQCDSTAATACRSSSRAATPAAQRRAGLQLQRSASVVNQLGAHPAGAAANGDLRGAVGCAVLRRAAVWVPDSWIPDSWTIVNAMTMVGDDDYVLREALKVLNTCLFS